MLSWMCVSLMCVSLGVSVCHQDMYAELEARAGGLHKNTHTHTHTSLSGTSSDADQEVDTYMCLYLSSRAYMYVSLCVIRYTHACVCVGHQVHTYRCRCVSVSVHTYMCLCVSSATHIYVSMCLCVSSATRVCLCV
jgi:hypothetical protein